MSRSPQDLRSGPKGQRVPLSRTVVDKRTKVQRSLSTPDNLLSPTITMAPGNSDKNKTSAVIDPDVLSSCVKQHLADAEVVDTIVAGLRVELTAIVEAAVKSALVEVNARVDTLSKEVVELKAELERLRETGEKLGNKSDELEQYQRRNNIRIFGIEEVRGEDTDKIVDQLCRDKLGVQLAEGALCRTHRVGAPPRPAADGRARHRPIIVRFASYRDRRLVFGAKRQLKGSGITIREDLTSQRLAVLRAAAAEYGYTNTWSQDGRVHWLDKDGRRGTATAMADLENKQTLHR